MATATATATAKLAYIVYPASATSSYRYRQCRVVVQYIDRHDAAAELIEAAGTGLEAHRLNRLARVKALTRGAIYYETCWHSVTLDITWQAGGDRDNMEPYRWYACRSDCVLEPAHVGTLARIVRAMGDAASSEARPADVIASLHKLHAVHLRYDSDAGVYVERPVEDWPAYLRELGILAPAAVA